MGQCISRVQILWLSNHSSGTIFQVSDQIRSNQSLSCVWLFATPWIAARQASLSITNSRSSLRLMSIKSVMPSSHLILCHPLLLLPPIPPSIRVFSNESTKFTLTLLPEVNAETRQAQPCWESLLSMWGFMSMGPEVPAWTRNHTKADTAFDYHSNPPC